ncbi:cadherin-like beta sandwich domain-containing protein [Paenibacillus thermotolerans]|uniref:cadherin-like beta sandwich domain-containing protein n=1 Tax=Paenibacillus thermotolerans TaxID=3027807 RepID=UPI002368439A|nr:MULTISPECIES: cadherin-like beta sandwich domain-containing protein [unclassified Paenibacillus]
MRRFLKLFLVLLVVGSGFQNVFLQHTYAAGATITWTGGGTNNYWSNQANWSTNTVPDQYDIVIFDGTSSKNAVIDREAGVYSLTIASGYEGTISTSGTQTFTVNQNLAIHGGGFNFSGVMTVKGTTFIDGGTVQLNAADSAGIAFMDDVAINGGNVSLNAAYYGYYYKVYGDFAVNRDGVVEGSANTSIQVYVSGTQTFDTGASAVTLAKLIVENGTSPTKLTVDGLLNLNNAGSYFQQKSAMDLLGTISFGPDAAASSTFENTGTLTVSAGAVIDARNAKTYVNYGTVTVDGLGTIQRNAAALGFTDASGVVPVAAVSNNTVYITLYDDNVNVRGNAIDQARVTVTNGSDSEEVILNETGPNKGMFIGSIATALSSVPGDGKLAYAGSENIQVSYTDANDSGDTMTRSLHQPDAVWDGGGSDGKWSDPLNWTGDRLPTLFDNVKFDGTSGKDAVIDRHVKINDFTMAANYTGKITAPQQFDWFVEGNAVIRGGTLDNQSYFAVKGTTDIAGGNVKLKTTSAKSEGMLFRDDVTISGGTVSFDGYYYDNYNYEYYNFKFYGDFNIIGGTVTGTSNASFHVYVSGTQRFDTGSNALTLGRFAAFNGNSPTKLTVAGDVRIVRANGAAVNRTIVEQSGTVTFTSAASSAVFDNAGTFAVADGAVLDARNAKSYINTGAITVSGTGSIKRTASVVGFTDAEGKPVNTISGNNGYVTLYDDNVNTNGSAKDKTTVTVINPATGDEQSVEVTETDIAAGKFIGSFATAALAYGGTENDNLQVTYTDAQDSEDTLTGYLQRDPLVWDGGGADTNWSNPENWSNNKVPSPFDSVSFTAASMKDVTVDLNVNVLNVTVGADYRGKIGSDATKAITVNGDLKISGGTFETQGDFEVKGKTSINGGTVNLLSYHPQQIHFSEDVTISGGTVNFGGYYTYFHKDFLITKGTVNYTGYYYYIYGDFDVAGGNVSGSWSPIFYVYVSGDQLFNAGDRALQARFFYVYAGTSPTKLTLAGHIKMDTYGSEFNISANVPVELAGKLEFGPNTANSNSTLLNNGTLTIGDGAVLDLRNAGFYKNNNKIVEEGTGGILRWAKAIGITDENGNPALSSFRFGSPLIVSLVDENRNLDATVTESVYVTLYNWTNGDEERLDLTEVGVNKGEFRNLSGFTTGVTVTEGVYNTPTNVTPYDGIFIGDGASAVNDAIQIVYQDPKHRLDEQVISINAPSQKMSVITIGYPNKDVTTSPGRTTFTITNTGDKPLELRSMVIDDPENFKFAGDPDLTDLGPNQSRTFEVWFTPSTYGTKQANLLLTTNDYRKGTTVIPLSGTADHTPTAGTIPTVVVNGTTPTELDLTTVFTDEEDTAAGLQYSIVGNTNPSLFSGVELDPVTKKLKLTYAANKSGTANITVRGTDSGGLFKDTTFTVKLYAPNNADLADLSLGGFGLNPAFDPEVTSYSVNVANTVTSVTVQTSPISPNAGVTVNDQAVDGAGAKTVTLTDGLNEIKVTVLAEDGITRKTYTINVTKAETPNPDLGSIAVSAGTLSPAFDPNVMIYNVSVPNGTDSITVTPAVSDSRSTLWVNGTMLDSGETSEAFALTAGDTRDITIIVTAHDGTTTKTYTIHATRQLSNVAKLGGLIVNGGYGFSPAFDADVFVYSMTVENDVSEITLAPAAGHPNATVTVNGRTGANRVSLSVGTNEISIVVTAEDGVTAKTYTLNVLRKAAPGTSAPAPAPAPEKKEQIKIDVVNGQGGTPVSATVIERTTSADGTVKDQVTFTQESVVETVEKLAEQAIDTARLVIPDTNDIVDEVNVTIPEGSLGRMKDGNINLEIFTENAKIFIPKSTLSGFDEELYFRIVPIKKESEKNIVIERAKKEEAVREIAKGRQVEVLGRPAVIETNMESQPVTITLPLKASDLPSAGAERENVLNNLVIFIEHDDGTKELVRGKLVTYKEGTLGVEFGIDKFSTFTMVYMDGAEAYFARLDQEKEQELLENQKPAETAEHKRYMFGFEDGTFRPNASVTRAQMALMLYRNLNIDTAPPSVSSYADVAENHWAFEAIEAMLSEGIMQGSNGRFRADAPLKRGEMAQLVANVLQLTKPAELTGYSDVGGHWAEQAIANVVAAGYMIGYGDGTFRPNEALTRAEAVKVLNLVFKRGPLNGMQASVWRDVGIEHWSFDDIMEASTDHRFTLDADGNERIVQP